MVTRVQVLRLIGRGRSYEQAGAELDISPGQAFMIATGLPADGSMALAPEERRRPGMLPDSTQRLSNPPHVNPTVKPEVLAWIKRRATSDLTEG